MWIALLTPFVIMLFALGMHHIEARPRQPRLLGVSQKPVPDAESS
ncbi:hypothetical protein [Kibdelosporangium phytohabitans]|nr:hypothetical protein [Kibdelosporangium phytohabitans]MBE1461700.1 hypothetical protein [Kibdelosporangium phytohabitans]